MEIRVCMRTDKMYKIPIKLSEINGKNYLCRKSE